MSIASLIHLSTIQCVFIALLQMESTQLNPATPEHYLLQEMKCFRRDPTGWNHRDFSLNQTGKTASNWLCCDHLEGYGPLLVFPAICWKLKLNIVWQSLHTNCVQMTIPRLVGLASLGQMRRQALGTPKVLFAGFVRIEFFGFWIRSFESERLSSTPVESIYISFKSQG